ncbi:3-keto-5-aminohexanoate cleavage protein [Pseudooceanicola onchidii]|uniref:3-keto-5-aminohexanoate cleavage protein n=1 Tax=Pseudooceanicola onchidii TaxID=2562279 RepID=UPI0010AA8463|nr:3-keto-5-aminohexanoate cleavage protein [Pseudooceanicola onchidii]
MPLSMPSEVFVTCAVTGSGQTQDRSPHVPRSPQQIAESALAAARAGAAAVHLHVRDPATGAPSRDPALYRECVDRIRDADTDVVINLTAGMGGDLILGGTDRPLPPGPGTDMIGAEERLIHIADCLPEICTLDCGTMNFAENDYVMTNSPGMLREMGRRITALGVLPEIECFDTGHLWFARQLVDEGVLSSPALVQLCMGVPWGAPNDLQTLQAMVANIPEGWTFSAFGLGRHQMPYVAAAVLSGGHVRVGLEDNLWLERGRLATNADLVEKAVTLIETLGPRVMGPVEMREKLGLVKRAPGGRP